jgi:hypothetical protein
MDGACADVCAGLTAAQVFRDETWAGRWQRATVARVAGTALPTGGRGAPARTAADARRTAALYNSFPAHPIYRALAQRRDQLATHQLILEPGAHRRLHVPSEKLRTLDRLVAAMAAEEGSAPMVVETLGELFRFGADVDIKLEAGVGLRDDRHTLAALLYAAYFAVEEELTAAARRKPVLVMLAQYRAPSAGAGGCKAGVHLSFGDEALVSRADAIKLCASVRRAVGELFVAEGWLGLELDPSIYDQGLRLPFCRKWDGSPPYLPLARVGMRATSRAPPSLEWLDGTFDANDVTAFIAAARLRTELVAFVPVAHARRLPAEAEARGGARASRGAQPARATSLVEWLNATLAAAPGVWPAVHTARVRADAREALIAICSTRCAHCDLAGRAHAAGRTLLYFANRFGLDLCCSDQTCVAAHASRPGLGTVRIRRFNWRRAADGAELQTLLRSAER